MNINVEYDDGKPIELKGKAADDRSKYCTPRGRSAGFYARVNGVEMPVSIGYMRVSEMEEMRKVLEGIYVEAQKGRLAQMEQQRTCNAPLPSSTLGLASTYHNVQELHD
jgi:hypothetical protein